MWRKSNTPELKRMLSKYNYFYKRDVLKGDTELSLTTPITDKTGNKAGYELAPPRPWDTSICRYGSIDKAFQQLGFTAVTDLNAGLGQTLEWIKENLSKVEECIARHSDKMKDSKFEN